MAATLLQRPSQLFSSDALYFPKDRRKPSRLSYPKSGLTGFSVRAVQEKTEDTKTPSSPDEITKKYGLEAGLWKKMKMVKTEKAIQREIKQKNSWQNTEEHILPLQLPFLDILWPLLCSNQRPELMYQHCYRRLEFL